MATHRIRRHLKVAAVVAVAVLTYAVVSGQLTAGAASLPMAPSKPGFGLAMPTIPGDLAPLQNLTTQLGASPGVLVWYNQWSSTPDFPAAAASTVTSLGAVPEITWEPWDPSRGVDQPAYSLASITAGAHDAYLRTWAKEIKAWGQPLKIRFAQEMNGNWYPWGEGVNGNGPTSYVAAWRHINRIFRGVGVHNVSWVWSPNVSYAGSPPLADFWPGEDYVNEAALDGYNWGTTGTSGWQTFSQVFAPSLHEVSILTSMPVWLGEVGCASTGGDKTAWVADMFATLAVSPRIRGFTWFDFDKEADWRIDSSAASLAAFATGLATLSH